MKNSIKTLIILALTSISLPTVAQNNAEIDSLIKVMETMPEDTNMVATLNKLIYKFYNSNPEKFKYYTEQSFELSKKINFKKGIMKSYYFFGVYYRMIGDNDLAIENIEKGLGYKKEHFNNTEITYFWELIGDIYKDKGNYHLSIENYLKVLKIAEKNKNKEEIASLKLRIGSVLMDNNMRDEAITYFEEAYKLFKELNNKRGMGISLTYIARFNHEKKRFKKALSTYTKVISLYEDSNVDLLLLADINAHIASVYTDMNKFEQAINHYEKSLSISNKINHKLYQTITMAEIAYVYVLKKQYTKSVKLSHKSINISKQIKAPQTLINPYQNLSLAYIGLLNKDSAEFYFNAWQNISDSINSSENREMITEMQTKYETEKKEKEIITLTKEKELQKAESKNKTYFIIVLALIILLVFITFYILTKQQKQKNIQKVAEARIKGMEEEQNRMSRELHDGIGSKLSAFRTKLLLLKNKTITENELNKLVEENTQINKEVRFLSHNLSSPELTGENFDTVLNDFAFKTSHSGNLKVNYSSSMEKKWNKIPVTKQTEIYRISQEILHNIVKHSKATEAFIQLMQHDKSFNILAEDNGIGFDTETVKTGIGLKNIYQRVKLLGGTVEISSQINKGTIINIEIPF